MNLQQHPLSAAFPSMSGADLDSLTEDIKQHGQREPGVLFEDMVLDGWHRYLACEKVGVEFKTSKLNGEDPVAFVLSHNLHRRHLTASQRAACIVAATNWRPTGVTDSRRAPGAHLSNKQLADKAEVSERTIKDAKAAHVAGLGEEVSSGRVSAKRAAQVAKLPKAKREKALKEPKTPKKPSFQAGEVTKLHAEIEKLRAEVAEANEKREAAADEGRDALDKLTAFETKDPDDQQKLIMTLQKKIVRLQAEVDRLTIARNECNNKNNQLIRQVKILQKAK